MNAWMVRAGEGGRYFENFRTRSFVGLGWRLAGDIRGLPSREEVFGRVKEAYSDRKDQSNFVSASILYRFAQVVAPGDRVVTYDPGARSYLCGTITGDCTYHPEEEVEEFQNQRAVQWSHERARDELSIAARNTLGATLSLFAIAEAFAQELWGKRPEQSDNLSPIEATKADAPLVLTAANDRQVAEAATEAIKDMIAALDWAQMQELVAGLLRSMGYKATVSPQGADRGKDILASPDGFGFQEPRIVVEVKHRVRERMSSQAIRSFLGGRHARDKGLFVSTGGFTTDALYEAERASIPLTLLDFDGLVAAILANYARFDEESRQLLPLRTVYWPISR